METQSSRIFPGIILITIVRRTYVRKSANYRQDFYAKSGISFRTMPEPLCENQPAFTPRSRFHRWKKFLIRTLDCVPLPRNDKAINHRVFLAFSGSSVNRRLPWFLSINQIRSSDTRITINFNCFNKTRRGIRRINLRFNEKNFRRRALFCRCHFFASSEDSSLRGYSSRDEFLTRDEGNSVSKNLSRLFWELETRFSA